MIRNININKLKIAKFSLMISTSLLFSLHTFLPETATHKQVNQEIESNIEDLLLGDEDDINNYLNSSNNSYLDGLLLKNRNIVSIDMYKLLDLSNLKDFKNLSTLEIKNAQLLSNNDINIINQLDLDDIYLKFSFNDIIRNINNKFDFNRFKDKSLIKTITYTNVGNLYEYHVVVLCNYFENYDNISCLDLREYEKVNNKIDSIIENIGLEENDTEFRKIIKNYLYVSKHIDYDPLVRDMLNLEKNYDNLNYDEKKFYLDNMNKVDKLTADYNIYSLSSIIDNKNTIENGVCINFSNFFSILCLKEGIPMYCVDGIVNNTGHSWNLYYSDLAIDPVYIDCTFLDHSYILIEEIQKYLYDPSNALYKKICDDMFVSTKSDSIYSAAFDVETFIDRKYKGYNVIGTSYPHDNLLVILGTMLYYLLIELGILKYQDERDKIAQKNDIEELKRLKYIKK